MRPGRWLGRRLPVDRHLKAVPREAWGSGSSGSSGSSGAGSPCAAGCFGRVPAAGLPSAERQLQDPRLPDRDGGRTPQEQQLTD